MAKRRKVRVRDFNTSNRRGSGYRNGYMKVSVSVSRTQGERAKHGFEACATLSRPSGGGNPHLLGRGGRRTGETKACAFGPAPRRAVASALASLGKILVGRSSAFRGAFGSPKGRAHRGFKHRRRGIARGYGSFGGFGSPKGRQHRGAPRRRIRRRGFGGSGVNLPH